MPQNPATTSYILVATASNQPVPLPYYTSSKVLGVPIAVHDFREPTESSRGTIVACYDNGPPLRYPPAIAGLAIITEAEYMAAQSDGGTNDRA